MIKINLLPVSEKVKEQSVRREIYLGVLLFLISIGVMGYVWYQKTQQIEDLKDQKARMEKRLAALKKEVGDINVLKKKKEALERRKEAIANLSRNRLAMVKVLDELSDSKPRALFFTKLEQKNQGPPWEDFGLTLTGVATDNEVIAQFMRNLEKIMIPGTNRLMFQSVDLDYTKAKKMRKAGGTYQEFRLNLRISSEEKAPETAALPSKRS